MKYLPLVWAALWRKPVRLTLTLLSVAIAFMLFGMMTGFQASFSAFGDIARPDRIAVNPRFSLPLSLALRDTEQFARMPGVLHVAPMAIVIGYYQNPRNVAFALMVDGTMRAVLPEMHLMPQQYAELAANRSGVFFSQAMAQRFHVKPGDIFPVKAPGIRRADGGITWTFKVLGIIDDMAIQPGGFIAGNLQYFDESKVQSERGQGYTYRVVVNDPARGDAMAKLIDQTFANSGTPTRSITEKTAVENLIGGGGGIDFPFIMESIAGAGLFMILFLTGNSIAQSVRERIPEFAVLKTIGFSDGGVMALVFAEAAIPCLSGAAIGMALATLLAAIFPRLLPPNRRASAICRRP